MRRGVPGDGPEAGTADGTWALPPDGGEALLLRVLEAWPPVPAARGVEAGAGSRSASREAHA